MFCHTGGPQHLQKYADCHRAVCPAPLNMLYYHIMSLLLRRLAKLEARRPAQGPAQMVDASLLDPTVLALWLAVDIDKMTLAQLDLLETSLRKLPV